MLKDITPLVLKRREKNKTLTHSGADFRSRAAHSELPFEGHAIAKKFARAIDYLVAISSNFFRRSLSFFFLVFFFNLFYSLFNLSFRLIIGEHPGKIRHLREISFICMYDIHIYTPIFVSVAHSVCVYTYTINVN